MQGPPFLHLMRREMAFMPLRVTFFQMGVRVLTRSGSNAKMF